jgi:hypothetical protein
MSQRRRYHPRIAALVVLVAVVVAGTDCAAAWKAEPDVDIPSYAVTEVASTNLNIDSVVLMCEPARDVNVLQFQIYLSGEGPFRPNGVPAERLKADPRAEITVDSRVFPVSILFADEYVVLADSQRGRFPLLSDRLLDALQEGKRMVVRFDLAEHPDGAATFDGEAVIELESPAIAAVRRCASPPAVPRAANAGGVAFAKY